MGVAVLQLYPVTENRTGPQVVELLTKRIMNQGWNFVRPILLNHCPGATQTGQFVVDCEVHQSVNQPSSQPPKNL